MKTADMLFDGSDAHLAGTVHDHYCHCGTSEIDGKHETGAYGCVRFMTDAPDLREGETLDYPYIRQRGYFQHPCGCWSTHGDSYNSLDWDD